MAMYLGFARERVKMRFLTSNVATDYITRCQLRDKLNCSEMTKTLFVIRRRIKTDMAYMAPMALTPLQTIRRTLAQIYHFYIGHVLSFLSRRTFAADDVYRDGLLPCLYYHRYTDRFVTVFIFKSVSKVGIETWIFWKLSYFANIWSLWVLRQTDRRKPRTESTPYRHV